MSDFERHLIYYLFHIGGPVVVGINVVMWAAVWWQKRKARR